MSLHDKIRALADEAWADGKREVSSALHDAARIDTRRDVEPAEQVTS